MAMESSSVGSLLLVRNGVDHDARVLRAARVAERALQGTALVVGVATTAAPAGASTVEGVRVLRLPPRAPRLTRLARGLQEIWISLSRSSGSARKPLGPSSAAAIAAQHAPTNGGRHADTATGSGAPRKPRPTDIEAPALSLAGRAGRILSGLSFSRQAASVARRTRPGLVQANDWNTMWAGLAIKLGYGARLVYDTHELWPDRNGRWEWRPWLVAAEALFVRAADEVVTSSSGYADVLAARYRIPRPTVVRNIPERVPGPLLPSDECPAPARISTGPVSRSRVPAGRVSHGVRAQVGGPLSPARVVYVGGLMPGRGLEQMIDALPLLPDVRLCAIGPGAPRYRAGLLARAAAAGVGERIVLRAPVAPGEVHRALTGASAGLCLIQPICRSYELSLPNKLFEYAAARVPVLASEVPVIAAVVRANGLGEVVPDGGPRAIAASLGRLLEPDGWRRAAERAGAFAEAHDWPDEARALAGVYRRAAPVGRAGRGVAP